MTRSRTALAALALALALLAAPPAARPARALDLEQVLREVAAGNPTLAARRDMVAAARARVPQAGAWPSPMFDLGAVSVPISGRFDEEPMTMKMLGLAQRVPLSGRTGIARRSARAGVTAEGAAAEMAHYEFLGMAWQAYADAYYAAARAGRAEDQRGVMDRLVRSSRARYESGGGRLDDVLRAEAERARTLADLAAFRAEERAARARLDALRGRAPGDAGTPLEPPPAMVIPADPAAWRAAVDDAHPRLRELDARVARDRFAARAARRMAWPDLEIRGSYGFRQTLQGGRTQDDMWSATLAVMLPVFAAQREFAEGAEMDAMADAGAAERHAAALDLEAGVAAVHAEAIAAQRTVHLMADTVVVTQRRALDASWSAYTVGTTDLWRALEAAHALYNEELVLTRAEQALAGAEARFLSLTGRGDLLGIQLPPALKE